MARQILNSAFFRSFNLVFAIIFILVFPVIAQNGLPFIKTYSVENYHAGVENWDVVQDNKGLMYFANSEGILEFDGVHWRLLQTKNNNKIRSLSKTDDGTIYVGGDSEIGYLKDNQYGQKTYFSIEDNCPEKYRQNLSHVWKVIIHQNKKLFLASGTVLIFDEQNNFVKALEEDIYLRSLFLIDDNIYAYSNKKGILIFENKSLSFNTFYNKEFVLNRSLEFISGHPEGGIRFHVFDKGFFRLHKGTLSYEKKTNSNLVDTDYIFCQQKTDKMLLLGTTINGIYAISDKNLNTLFHINKNSGLNDNKVFSVFSDYDQNIWICHEDGISYMEYNAPVRYINEKLGVHGTGYCTSFFDSTVFAGTSHGLFAAKPKSEGGLYDFSIFKLIRQPTYFLEKRGNSLLIGCHLELFEYDGKELKTISKIRHNTKIKQVPNHQDLYLLSNNQGFQLLKYENGFNVIRQIESIDNEILDFEFDEKGVVWFINGKHELISANLNHTQDTLKNIINFRINEFKDVKFSGISVFKERMFLGTSKGLFYYNPEKKTLKKYLINKPGDKNEYAINWLHNQNNKQLWYEKSYYSNGKLNYKIDALTEEGVENNSASLNSIIYGNKAFSLGHFRDSDLAIGTSEGFLLYDQAFDIKNLRSAEAFIRKISVTDAKDTTELYGNWTGEENKFPIPLNQEITHIEVDLSTNYFYSQNKVMYSCKMEGIDKEWKPWSKENSFRYTFNGDGEYNLLIKAVNHYNTESNITSYRFSIKDPWYKSIWWYTIQTIILLSIMFFSVYLNRNGNAKISKMSAFVIVLFVLTVFETTTELIQDWMDAQGVTIFALKISVNILIALSIKPAESWVRKKIIRPVHEEDPVSATKTLQEQN